MSGCKSVWIKGLFSVCLDCYLCQYVSATLSQCERGRIGARVKCDVRESESEHHVPRHSFLGCVQM